MLVADVTGGSGGTAPTTPDGGGPLAGTELLNRLRGTGRPRPPADPTLTRRLRCRLDDALTLCDRSGPHGDADRRVVVTKAQLTRLLTCDVHVASISSDHVVPTRAMACGAIVDAAFRHLVTMGSIDDPMAEALAALRVGGRHDELLAWIADLPDSEWSGLTDEVQAQTDGLCRRWPRLDPAWMPRTQESMRVQVAGGAVELATRVDLALGVPGEEVASVALVEVKSGIPRPEHGADLGFAALIESLRNTAPPFAVATYYTRTGDLRVEPVSEAELLDAADRTIAGVSRHLAERRGAALDAPPEEWCAACRQLSSVRGAGPVEARAGGRPVRGTSL